MPRRDWRHRIEDMLNAIDRIQRYTAGVDRVAFLNNPEKVDAVIHNIIILGEAANHLPDAIRQATPSVPWHQIRGMRNLLVHVYWGTEAAEAWETVERDLSPLRQALQAILEQPPNLDLTTP